MPPKRSKGDAATANLLRVRNNQRRSRARKREYIEELERKIHECEANGVPERGIVPQDTIRRLEEENKKLRELLDLAGVQRSAVDHHLKTNINTSSNILQSCSEISLEGLAAVLMPPATGASMSGDFSNSLPVPDDSPDHTFAASFLPMASDDFDMFFDPIPDISSSEPFPTPQVSVEAPTSSIAPICLLPSSTPSNTPPSLCAESSLPLTSSQSTNGTTLCSEAYEMLRQQNKNGIDMIEIGIRLWNGFTKGDGDGGCRVENKLLFSVLEYISG